MKTYLYILSRNKDRLPSKRIRLIDGSAKPSASRYDRFEKVLTLEDDADPKMEIIYELLDCKRESRYIKLVTDFGGDFTDVKAFHDFLPPIYRPFASDIPWLKEQLGSLHEMTSRYTILDVKEASPCYGCRNELPSQYDHMECNTGCLHEPMLCRSCPVETPVAEESSSLDGKQLYWTTHPL